MTGDQARAIATGNFLNEIATLQTKALKAQRDAMEANGTIKLYQEERRLLIDHEVTRLLARDTEMTS